MFRVSFSPKPGQNRRMPSRSANLIKAVDSYKLYRIYVKSLIRCITLTGIPSLYQVMTGVGLPVTSHKKLVDWLSTRDVLPGESLSRKSGGTVEASNRIICHEHSYEGAQRKWKKLFQSQWDKPMIRGQSPLTLSWYFFSVDPASLTAAQVYSPLSSGDREARMSSVPSSRMDTPGSLPVSSWPLRNHRITGFGRPEEQKSFTQSSYISPR